MKVTNKKTIRLSKTDVDKIILDHLHKEKIIKDAPKNIDLYPRLKTVTNSSSFYESGRYEIFNGYDVEIENS